MGRQRNREAQSQGFTVLYLFKLHVFCLVPACEISIKMT